MTAGVRQWSVLPSGNANQSGIPMYEGMSPAQLNDSIRVIMAEMAKVAPTTINPAEYGAKGDGVTDDTVAFGLALAAAGKMVVQGDKGKVYAITNSLDLSAYPVVNLRDVTFKQLNPAPTTTKTIYNSAANIIRFQNVKVDRNGDGAGGSQANASGIWLDGCARVELVQTEVTGNDHGTGIRILNCTSGFLLGCWVHDMTHGTATSVYPGVGADQIDGIWIINCKNLPVLGCTVERLLGRWSGQAATNQITRGFSLSGSEDISFEACTVDTVEQGFDFSGDNNHRRITVTGCHAKNCHYFGFKATNTIQRLRYVNCDSWRCGLAGFTYAGTNSAVAPDVVAGDCTYLGCEALETGVNGPGTGSYGFKIENTTHIPLNVRYLFCRAVGSTDLGAIPMDYGFANQNNVTPYSQWPRAFGCESENHTNLAFSGFTTGSSVLTPLADQAIPADGGFHSVTFDDLTTSDGDGLPVTAGIVLPYDGYYTLRAGVCFEDTVGHRTGSRIVDLSVNGTPFGGVRVSQPCCPDTATLLQLVAGHFWHAGDVITIRVSHTEGAPINVKASDSSLLLAQPPMGPGL